MSDNRAVQPVRAEVCHHAVRGPPEGVVIVVILIVVPHARVTDLDILGKIVTQFAMERIFAVVVHGNETTITTGGKRVRVVDSVNALPEDVSVVLEIASSEKIGQTLEGRGPTESDLQILKAAAIDAIGMLKQIVMRGDVVTSVP